MQIPEEIKQDFSREPLERRNLHADPLVQFETWFGEACDEGIPAPNAMTLATVCSDASPTARTVLLKIYDRNGFVFFDV